MKLKEFLREYYKEKKEVTMKSRVIERVLNELILPGTFKDLSGFRKTISWNLDRDVYYRKVTKEFGSEDLYVILTTGKMDFYLILDTDQEFQEFLDKGLKKHRGYRRESIPYDSSQVYLYYSRKYE